MLTDSIFTGSRNICRRHFYFQIIILDQLATLHAQFGCCLIFICSRHSSISDRRQFFASKYVCFGSRKVLFGFVYTSTSFDTVFIYMFYHCFNRNTRRFFVFSALLKSKRDGMTDILKATQIQFEWNDIFLFVSKSQRGFFTLSAFFCLRLPSILLELIPAPILHTHK